MKMRGLQLLIAPLLLLTFEIPINAQNPGTLDPSFGGNGIVLTDVNNLFNFSSAIAIQPDGKIIVGGRGTGFTFMRYNADGTLDSSFGTGGIVTSVLTPFGEEVKDLALQSDGKIVAVGENNAVGTHRFVVARYNSGGSLDTTFGPGGFVTTSFGNGSHFGNAIAIQTDGKIIVAGAAFDGSNPAVFAVVRYNSDGTLDPSFGSGGKVTTASGGGGDQAQSVNLAPGGKIVVAGIGFAATRDFEVVRYNSDGSRDATFGNGGIVLTNINFSDTARDSVVQSDGKIIVAGDSNTLAAFAMVRYNSDGALDPTFGTGGIVSMPVGISESFITAVALQPDGKIIAAGESGVFPDRDLTLIRYTTGGVVDSTFGINGKVVTPIGNDTFDDLADIALQSDGRIVITGRSAQNPTTNFDSVVVRYLNDHFAPAPLQLILEESAPVATSAAAIDAVLFVRDPFPVINGNNVFNLAGDPNTRVVIFVANLQLLPGEPSSAVLVSLTDANNQNQNIAAEDVRIVPPFGFAQVKFKLPNGLAVGTCTISVSAHGQVSNTATIRIRI